MMEAIKKPGPTLTHPSTLTHKPKKKKKKNYKFPVAFLLNILYLNSTQKLSMNIKTQIYIPLGMFKL